VWRSVKDVCRENEVSEATYYKWKTKYGIATITINYQPRRWAEKLHSALTRWVFSVSRYSYVFIMLPA
jgi:hypothetical protein